MAQSNTQNTAQQVEHKHHRWRWVLLPVSIFLIFYLAYQIYMSVYLPYQTEVASVVTVSDTVELTGIPARDETVIQTDTSGSVCYFYDNGTKVAKDSEIAAVYADEASVSNILEARQLQEQLDVLTTVLDDSEMSSAEPSELATKLQSLQYELSELSDAGSASGVDDLRLSIIQTILTRKTLFGTAGNTTDLISSLQQQIASLSSATPLASITTSVSGFFASSTDGYESILTTETVQSMTAADLRELLSRTDVTGDSTAIGKVVTGFTWYYVAILPTEDAKRISVSSSVDLTLPSLGDEALSCTVVKTEYDDEADEGLILLSCDIVTGETVGARDTEATMTVAEYEGISVPKTAVRVKDGVKGVYVYFNNKVQFKELDVLYESDDVVISAIHSSDDGDYLQEYDDIIVKGKNLDELSE